MTNHSHYLCAVCIYLLHTSGQTVTHLQYAHYKKRKADKFLHRIIRTQTRIGMVKLLIKNIVTLIYKTADNVLAGQAKIPLQTSLMSNRLSPKHLWFGVKMSKMTGSKNFPCVEETSEQIIIHPKSSPFSETLSQSVGKQSGLQRLGSTMLF